ncbi:MAG: hypothetical protein JWO31_1058 [Phycisphaerales bacterium]|nr:hypothetical protein [Phycisphaerales bacterium]
MRSFLSIVAAPALCLGVLGGVVWDNGNHAKPQDAAPFHRAAKAAIDAWPAAVGDWAGRDEPLPAGAIALLKPNAHFCRKYSNPSDRVHAPVRLLVVQCTDPTYMSGHYPPNCYPNNGMPQVSQTPRTWVVPGVAGPISGMEYHFESGSMLRPSRTVVYNFFVLPGRGVVPDMDPVRQASGDYQRRHYGSAQIQVVFEEPRDGDPAWRDKMFAQLIAANAGVIATLGPAGI